MKKGFKGTLALILAASTLGGFMVGCDNNEPAPIVYDVDYDSVTIANKESLQEEWAVGSDPRQITLGNGLNKIKLKMDGRLTVTSSDPTVVAVDDNYNLTALKEGSSTITVTVKNSDGKQPVSDSVTVSVVAWIDPIQNKPTQVESPAVNVEYKLGIEHYGVTTPAMYYFETPVIPDGEFYWHTTTSFNAAATVMIEEVGTPDGNYKYAIKVGDTYLGIDSSLNSKGSHVNDTNETTIKTKWQWNDTYNCFTTKFVKKSSADYGETATMKWDDTKFADGDEVFLGAMSTYFTFQIGNMKEVTGAEVLTKKNGQYPGHLYLVPQELGVLEDQITVLLGDTATKQITPVKAQGTVTYTVQEGEEGIVTVDADGKLTAVAAGTAHIIVSDGSTEVTVTVTVRAAQAGETAANPLTLAQFIDKAQLLANKAISTEFYYVKAVVDHFDGVNKVFFDSTNYIYKLIDSTGTVYSSIEALPFIQGDEILVYGQLENYNGTSEMVSTKYISSSHPQTAVTASGEHATATISGLTEGKVENGQDVTFTVDVDSGYELVKVTAYGKELTADQGTYTLTVTGAVDIKIVTKEVGGEDAPGTTIETAFTPAQAIELINTLADGATTEEFYFVKGVVTDTPTSNYCNFHMGDLYFFGLNSIDDATKAYGTAKQIAEIPFYQGDELLVTTKLQKYVSGQTVTPECQKAQLISVTPGNVDVTVTENADATVSFSEGVTDNKATNGSTVKFTVSVASGKELVSVKVNGTAVEAVENVYSFVVKGPMTITVATKEEGSTEETWSEITLSAEGGTSADACKVVAGGTTYDGVKAGTGKVYGAMIIKLPAGATKLSFSAAAWNGKGDCTITLSGIDGLTSVTVPADTGVANNSPFNIAATDLSVFAKEVTFDALTEETSLTLTATGNQRFVIWNASYLK